MNTQNDIQRIQHLERLVDDATQAMALLRKENERKDAQILALVAENVGLKAISHNPGACNQGYREFAVSHELNLSGEICMSHALTAAVMHVETPATDAAIADIRAASRKEGAIFAANRILAAWDAGFVEDTPENAADIARAILTTIEFMDDAPEGDFDRSFADEMFESIAAQLRQEGANHE